MTIGKLVYKFGSDYTFIYLPSDTALIHQFYQDLKSKAIEVPEKQLFIYKGKLSVAQTDQVLYKENKPISNGRIDASINKEAWFNNDEKVIAEVWSSSYFFYSSCGTKTFAQKKYRKRFLWTSKDAWANENAVQLTVKTSAYGAFLLSQFSNNVKVTYRAGAYQIEVENTVTNDSNCEKQIASLTGFGVAKFNLWNIESYHTGQKYGITKSL